MRVEKYKSEFTEYDIDIIDENKVISMSFGGNGDLYWTYFSKDKKDNSFVIKKENTTIYNMFYDLYNSIKDCNVYKVNSSFNNNDEKNRIILLNKSLKQDSNYYKLYHDNMISWHCDDQLYDDANIVNISLENDSIVIKFDFKNKDLFLEDTIRFRNRGSNYMPFNLAFMDLFIKLQNYNFEEKKLIKNK